MCPFSLLSLHISSKLHTHKIYSSAQIVLIMQRQVSMKSFCYLHQSYILTMMFLQLLCGGLSRCTFVLFTTPFDVVKTRLQTQISIDLFSRKVIHTHLTLPILSGFQYHNILPCCLILIHCYSNFF